MKRSFRQLIKRLAIILKVLLNASSHTQNRLHIDHKPFKIKFIKDITRAPLNLQFFPLISLLGQTAMAAILKINYILLEINIFLIY